MGLSLSRTECKSAGKFGAEKTGLKTGLKIILAWHPRAENGAENGGGERGRKVGLTTGLGIQPGSGNGAENGAEKFSPGLSRTESLWRTTGLRLSRTERQVPL